MRTIFLLIFFLISGRCYSQDTTADSLDNKAVTDTALTADSVKTFSVNLLSLPDNAEVYSDTVLIGITPVLGIKLKEGVYDLKFINPKSGKYWENSNQVIKLDLKSDTIISAVFNYFYYFESDPFNASVLSSDSLLGYTPLRIFSEFKLTDNIIFRKENYLDYVFNISDYNFETGENIKLKSKGKISLDDNVYKNKGTQFNTKRNLPVIIGFGLASAAAAYFTYDFKTQGNQYYDEYLLTGNQQKLNESNTQDTYFVISLLLMEAAIGGLMYFLFFD